MIDSMDSMETKRVGGYVRLSRDDDKKNYASIENQKSIILTHAKSLGYNDVEFYEDDNISGYTFDRPSFNRLIDDLTNGDLDVVIAKDLSRIGRNNPKVLLLLDKFKELEKEIILIDDGYSSKDESGNDDVIGIKTWYNERYVKDVSKKIRSVISMKQAKGTWIVAPPFGYRIKEKKFYIIENEAEIIREIFELYISGFGYRMIANKFNEEKVLTPSMMMVQDKLKNGIKTTKVPAPKWSDHMVRDILKNDFYIGNLRTGKRRRKMIHGQDKRVSKNEQHVFENNHESIIDKNIFEHAQSLMSRRKVANYRGAKDIENISPFNGVLYCEDCGSKMTRIKRNINDKRVKFYYVCSSYNYHGTRDCSSHLVNETDLIEYTKLIIEAFTLSYKDLNEKYMDKDYNKNLDKINKEITKIEKQIEREKSSLKNVIGMKIADLEKYNGDVTFVEEMYSSMQEKIINKIQDLNKKIDVLTNNVDKSFEEKKEEVKDIYQKLKEASEELSKKTIDMLFDKITIDKDGIPEYIPHLQIDTIDNITMKNLLNHKKREEIALVYKLIRDDERGYTSAKYLSERATELGLKKHKKSILPYINLAINEGILIESGNPKKPYTIVLNRDEINKRIESYINHR